MTFISISIFIMCLSKNEYIMLNTVFILGLKTKPQNKMCFPFSNYLKLEFQLSFHFCFSKSERSRNLNDLLTQELINSFMTEIPIK